MDGQGNTVTMKGEPLPLAGGVLKTGEAAPDVELIANDLTAVRLADYQGKIRVILSVPSLDTSVCDVMARKFNEQAVGLGEDVVVLAVSMDLPFAQGRWCGSAGVKNVQTLSDHREGAFGRAFGVLIKGLRLLARAVFVLDKQGIIRYVQIVKELTDEPDYQAALDAVGKIAAKRQA